jgi:large subunit ribosomal protein L2
MGIRQRKPTTPSNRWTTLCDFQEITKDTPEKSLLGPMKKSGGRNLYGRITSRHRGGGHKKRYRIIDFKRLKRNITARVLAIEYDPNRTSRIALLQYEDGTKSYIICPAGLSVGEILSTGPDVEIKIGNSAPLANIPPGTLIHNIELVPGKGGQFVRSAGSAATIMAKEGKFAHIKMPSGEIRLMRLDCYATIGQVSNIEHSTVSVGKAGRSRWYGIRPASRGVAKNPHDHPMGGGEGKSSGGRHPCTPWGKPTKGYKTRKPKKHTNKYIIKDRRVQVEEVARG